MKEIEAWCVAFGNYAWGMPLLTLLLGGGIFFMMYSRFLPFRYFGHAINILRGKYDDPDDPGEIDHYQALSGAIAATVGMGNISGVAVAIATGGPGALFWMWVSALFGCATKFFTCTLAVMYRGKDTEGNLEGGPMYVITEGLGKQWKPLAVFFAVVGLFGVSPMFQANQLTQVIRDVVLTPAGMLAPERWMTDVIIGTVIMLVVSLVIFGGIQRISNVAGKLVPFMIVLYTGFVLYIIFSNFGQVPVAFEMIFEDAFTGDAILGGSLGAIIVAGARRAAFSNEAGIGTAPMIHGAAKTKEPVREGLVAMLGPAIDTILVCTMTALAILITGVWQTSDSDGVTLTAAAFSQAAPMLGHTILVICVLIFSITTLFTFSYYGTKCTSFLLGAKYKGLYNYLYAALIVCGAVFPMKAVISLMDGMYAMMAIPTMVSALLLSPKVMKAATSYFKRVNEMEQEEVLDVK
ncbi:alanine/glycine:cation symporter family protein [Limibacter armeniacum]|uniref:alanine/glycine:cation symporter family protein n=1 Tax=Limibacter armeniacum TaxID=466084 RepID=UPI002FE5823F